MKSAWRVTSNVVGVGIKCYSVYRLIESREVDHSGNREYYGGPWLMQRERAAEIAEALNAEKEDIA